MAEVKVPPLLHKMSVSSQKAWYKKNNMELPGHLTGAEGKSAAQAKKDVGEINKEKAKAERLKTIAAVAKKIIKPSSDRVRAMRHNADYFGGGLGGGLDRNRDIVSFVRSGGYIKAGRLGEGAEQMDEGSKRMSAAVKLQRAFDREKAVSDASRKRGEEMLAQARAEYAKKQAAKTNEEVEQIDEVNYKKYLKVSQEKRPLTPSAVAVAMSAEKEGNPNPARKLRNTQDARKFANKQLTKQVAKTRPAQKFPVYEPGRKYVGDSVELDGPVIDESHIDEVSKADLRNSDAYKKAMANIRQKRLNKDYGKKSADGGMNPSADLNMPSKNQNIKIDHRANKIVSTYREEVEQVEEATTHPSDKELRMARGIAFGKRYKGGNMTAAVSAIEKIRSGLSDHPKVAAALRSANEEKEMSQGKKLAKKIMAQQSTHPIAQHMGEENVVEEETSLDEARVDHRELATAGIMHPDMANAPRMKTGNMTDFYSRKNGDKLQGKVLSNDRKTVRIEHEGKVHKFDVRRGLPTSMYKEDKDDREYGYEGDMAMSQLKSIIANAQRLHDMLKPETDLPEWVQSKITLAEDYVVTAANYCAGDLDESVNEEVEQIDEKYMGFKKVMAAVAAKGARNPAAVAAAIGRKKYGKEKFQAMAAAGKKQANEETVVEGSEGKTPETETEVNLAKKHGDPKKITYGDVVKARIESAKKKALTKGE